MVKESTIEPYLGNPNYILDHDLADQAIRTNLEGGGGGALLNPSIHFGKDCCLSVQSLGSQHVHQNHH